MRYEARAIQLEAGTEYAVYDTQENSFVETTYDSEKFAANQAGIYNKAITKKRKNTQEDRLIKRIEKDIKFQQFLDEKAIKTAEGQAEIDARIKQLKARKLRVAIIADAELERAGYDQIAHRI